MILDFDRYAQKGNEFMNQLEASLGITDRAHSGRILRSTLRVLRNHLTIEESFQLLAQLPMALKAVYVDGWVPGSQGKIKTADDFLGEIIQEEGNRAWRDFGTREDIIRAVRAVISTLGNYVSATEINQALGTLPRNVQELLRTSGQEH